MLKHEWDQHQHLQDDLNRAIAAQQHSYRQAARQRRSMSYWDSLQTPEAVQGRRDHFAIQRLQEQARRDAWNANARRHVRHQ
jgi:hypothetical protein